MKETGYVIYDKVRETYLTGWSLTSQDLIGARVYHTEQKAQQVMRNHCRTNYRTWDEFEIKKVSIELI